MTDPSLGAEAPRGWSSMAWVPRAPARPRWGSLGKPFLSLGLGFLWRNANGNPSAGADAGRCQAQSRHSGNAGTLFPSPHSLGRGAQLKSGLTQMTGYHSTERSSRLPQREQACSPSQSRALVCTLPCPSVPPPPCFLSRSGCERGE